MSTPQMSMAALARFRQKSRCDFSVGFVFGSSRAPGWVWGEAGSRRGKRSWAGLVVLAPALVFEIVFVFEFALVFEIVLVFALGLVVFVLG